MAKLELVEDPEILAQFGDTAPTLEPVDDPAILSQFDAPEEVKDPVDGKAKRQQLRAVSFQMLNDANRLSPRLQRDVADESSGVVGGTIRGGKRVLGGAVEVISELFTNPFSRTEAQTLNQAFGEGEAGKISEDLRATRDMVGWDAPQGKERGQEVIDKFIKHFEDNGVTDGKEMMTLLKDSIRENVWDPTTDDAARVLSDGDIRVNPKFVALPDANLGIAAINATSATPEAKEEALQNFKAGRKIAAKIFDEKTKGYDAGYRKHAEAQAAAGVTDPEQVFFSWPGLKRGFIKDKWDVVRDTVAEAGRSTMQTVRSLGMGLAEATGDTEDVERIGRDMLASSAKSQFVRDIAAARGQQGPIAGTGKELGTTVLQMAPMFGGAKLGRMIAGGTEANVARKMLGKATAATSVYGYAGMQGYGSLMQTALTKAEADAAAQGRELTAEEIDSTVEQFQGAALGNGLQTMLLSVLLSGGAEKAAMQGLTSQSGQMVGRDVLAAFRRSRGAGADLRQALTAVKPELVKFAKEAYVAGKVGFKDEAIEEGANQYIEGVITKLSGADADKTWDQIGQETWKGTWMGGVVGSGLPMAMKTIAQRDPVLVEAQRLAAEASSIAPEAAAEAAKDLDSPADATPAAGSEPAAGILSDEGTANDDGAAVEPGAADREAPGVGAADAAPDSGVPAAGALEPVAAGSPADAAPAPPAEVDATVEASDYAKARAADPALPSEVDAVTAAFAAGRPVSVSMVDQAGGFMADGSGLQTPAGYTRRGDLMVPPTDETAPLQTTPAAEAAPDTTGRGPSVPPAVEEAGTPAAQDTPVAEATPAEPDASPAPEGAGDAAIDDVPREAPAEPEPDLKEVFETLRGRSPEAAKVDTESPAFKGLVEEVRQKRAGRLAGELKRRQAEAAETRARMKAENTAKRKERERKKTEAKATRVLDKHEARIKEITGVNHDNTPALSRWMKARGYNGPLGKKKIAINPSFTHRWTFIGPSFSDSIGPVGAYNKLEYHE